MSVVMFHLVCKTKISVLLPVLFLFNFFPDNFYCILTCSSQGVHHLHTTRYIETYETTVCRSMHQNGMGKIKRERERNQKQMQICVYVIREQQYGFVVHCNVFVAAHSYVPSYGRTEQERNE